MAFVNLANFMRYYKGEALLRAQLPEAGNFDVLDAEFQHERLQLLDRIPLWQSTILITPEFRIWNYLFFWEAQELDRWNRGLGPLKVQSEPDRMLVAMSDLYCSLCCTGGHTNDTCPRRAQLKDEELKVRLREQVKARAKAKAAKLAKKASSSSSKNIQSDSGSLHSSSTRQGQ